MGLKVIIATHKKFDPPKSEVFLPIHGGRNGVSDLEYIGDDTGDHISAKNKTFCELTTLYWAWKNLEYDALGLCHYRRYFDLSSGVTPHHIKYIDQKTFKEYDFDDKKVEKYLKQYDVILPKHKVYEYSLKHEYCFSCSVEDLDILTATIDRMYPDYSETWDKMMNFNNKLIHFNMFITSKEIIDAYCEWLFSILFEVEKEVKLSPYEYQQRVFGFMGERLMQLYFTHHKFRIKYLPVLYVKDESFAYKTPSSLSESLSNGYKNFLFFLSSFPRRVKASMRK